MEKAKVFDFEQSLRRIDGDKELYRDLIGLFLEDSPKLLEQIRAGIAAKNAKEAGHGAHTLKGLAANFSGEPVIQAADQVERLSRTGAFAAVGHAFDHLEQETSLLQDALRSFQAEL
jgi:two-component system, sensor histidine kinase and response regulator